MLTTPTHSHTHINPFAATHTCADTGERESELSQEVISGSIVMILHQKADQSQVRDMDGKVKGAVPPWIKACNEEHKFTH